VSVSEVWMWNEWGWSYPLWGVEGPLDADELDLSAALAAHLQVWHLRWEHLYAYVPNADPELGWVASYAVADWEDDGDQLLVRLAEELDGRATVIRAFRFPEDEAGLRLRQWGSRVRKGSTRSPFALE